MRSYFLTPGRSATCARKPSSSARVLERPRFSSPNIFSPLSDRRPRIFSERRASRADASESSPCDTLESFNSLLFTTHIKCSYACEHMFLHASSTYAQCNRSRREEATSDRSLCRRMASSSSGLLIEKRLSASDLSDRVLKAGRIVLSRQQVGAHVERIVELGCCDYETAVVDKRTGSAQFELIFHDDEGRAWTILFKRWVSHAGPDPKPIYVLEKTKEMMKANGAKPGRYMRLMARDGTLHISVVDTPVASPSRGRSVGKTASEEGLAEGIRGNEHRLENRETADGGRVVEEPAEEGNEGMDPSNPQQTARAEPVDRTGIHAPNPPGPSATTYIKVKCGDRTGYLHIPTMEIIPLAEDGVSLPQGVSPCLTVNEFERFGGRGHCRRWQSSIAVPLGDDRVMPLGRWLSLMKSNSSAPSGSWDTSMTAARGSFGPQHTRHRGPLASLISAFRRSTPEEKSSTERSSRHDQGSHKEVSVEDGRQQGGRSPAHSVASGFKNTALQDTDIPSNQVDPRKSEFNSLGKRRFFEIEEKSNAGKIARLFPAIGNDNVPLRIGRGVVKEAEVHPSAAEGRYEGRRDVARQETTATRWSEHRSDGGSGRTVPIRAIASHGSVEDRIALVRNLDMENAAMRAQQAQMRHSELARRGEHRSLENLRSASQRASLDLMVRLLWERIRTTNDSNEKSS